jgi:hypothetical protein
MSKAAELAALIGTGASTSKRNMLMNGDMRVSQRNGTSAVTVSASAGAYTLDRWQLYTNSGNYSVQQITDSSLPSGFLNAAKITVSSVGNTSGSGNAVHFEQKIEANNISHLNWGGGNAGTAKTCTLSFFVKSSVTGTYSVHFGNDNDRFYVATYTVDSANTWEKKSITLAGPSDGTWNTGNGRGLEIVWVLLQGSGGTTSSLNQWISAEDFASTSTTQWGTNSGATFFLTGCQFEIAGVAQPFEHEGFEQNLARCQRYYSKVEYSNWSGRVSSGNAYYMHDGLRQTMRANPTASILSQSQSSFPTDRSFGDYTTEGVGTQCTASGNADGAYWYTGIALTAEL